jgi:hypothetical protein
MPIVSGLYTGDDDITALAGRLVAQQREIERLTTDLQAANGKRASLAQVLLGGRHAAGGMRDQHVCNVPSPQAVAASSCSSSLQL